MQIDNGSFEIVRHTHNALCADKVYIRVVCLVFRQLTVDKTLGYVEHHSVLESAVTLHPPRVLIVPHAQALGMPCRKL